jgi:hypothetical protein
MTQIDRSDDERNALRRARCMALDFYPVSDIGRHFCKELAQRVTDADPLRKNAREKLSDKFQRAVGAAAVDLLFGFNGRKSEYSYIPLQADRYTGQPVSIRHIRSVISGLSQLGLMELVAPGFKNHEAMGESFAGRYKTNTKLSDLFKEFGVTLGNIGNHFKRELPREPLRLTGPKKRGDRNPKPISFEITPKVQELYDQVHELNAFIHGFLIEGATFSGLRRIFSQGGSDDYQWNQGGRLYALGTGHYQQTPEDERLEMTIDHEPVVEIDIRASHLTIFHGVSGETFDPREDPYEITGFPRDIIKKWINVTFGKGAFQARWSRGNREDLGIENISKLYPAVKVMNAVLDVHPLLRQWETSKFNVFSLEFIESQIMVNTMLQLKRAFGLVSLPVHDSLICKVSDQNVVHQVLSDTFKLHCGITPYLRLNSKN